MSWQTRIFTYPLYTESPTRYILSTTTLKRTGTLYITHRGRMVRKGGAETLHMRSSISLSKPDLFAVKKHDPMSNTMAFCLTTK